MTDEQTTKIENVPTGTLTDYEYKLSILDAESAVNTLIVEFQSKMEELILRTLISAFNIYEDGNQWDIYGPKIKGRIGSSIFEKIKKMGLTRNLKQIVESSKKK